MENWGAIFYFEPYLSSIRSSREADRQRVFEVVVHEVAHQWFGNLVTMTWWDDLWLNEGFASWMAAKTTDHFHPGWNMWLHNADSREQAMRLDASVTTHPIIRAVKTLEEAELAFDDITYEKGSQVIRMMEAWVGEDAFRTAIRAHMRNHAYDTAVTGDLVREIDKVSKFPVADIARDFTEQAGVPMIEVLSTQCDRAKMTTSVSLKQSRFALDEPSKAARSWHVPVTAVVAGGKEIVRRIVRGPEAVQLDVPGCGAVKVNVRETGYFRTLYDAQSLASLRANYAALSLADQLGLLKDSRGLAEGQYLSFATYFDIADRLPATADPLLLLDYVRTAREIDRLYQGLPTQSGFRTFAVPRFAAILQRVGWVAAEGEPANTAILRDELIEQLGRMGDAATIAEANRRMRGSEKDPALLPAAGRAAAVRAAGAGATLATYEDFASRATRASDSAEKTLYLLSIGGANDPAIAKRVLTLALTNAVPSQLVSELIEAVARRHPELAFDFAAEHYDALVAAIGDYTPMYIARLASYGVDAAFARKFMSFSESRLGKNARESSLRAQAEILHWNRVRQAGLPQIDAWVKQRQSAR